MREGIHTFAAYAAIEWLIVQIGRVVFPSQIVVPIAPWYAAVVFVVFIAAGALAGLLVRERATFVLIALFALNALFLPSRFIRWWSLGVALLALIAHWLEPRIGVVAIGTALVAPAFAGTELFFQRSVAVRATAALATLLVVAIVAWLTRRESPRRPLFASLALVVVLAVSVAAHGRVIDSGPPRRSADPSRPNVVMITMDTVRADHLSLYGYARPTTPRLEQFAKSATLFRHAYAPSNMTLSSHASMFTGTFPTQHGARVTAEFKAGVPLDATLPTASGILSARGYRTIAIASNSIYLGRVFGVMRGFQRLDARPPQSRTAAHADFQLSSRISQAARRLLSLPPDHSGRRADAITRLALNAIDREQRPFFLFVNYFDAHALYLPPPPYDRMFDPNGPRFDPELPDRLFADQLAGHLHVTPDEQRFMIAQYDGAIRSIDTSIGALLDGLRARGLYDNTLIVITSDHGETFGERGLAGHGSSLYDDQIRVPLIVKRPLQRAAAVEQEPVSLVDLFGLVTHARTTFVSPVISEAFPFDAPPSFRRAGRAIVADGFKLIEPERGAPELYDLDEKPVRDPAAAQRLHALLAAQQWHSGEGTRPKLDSETERRLRALGYLR